MTDDAIVRLLGRACTDLMLATASETLDAGGCPPAELSDAHLDWFVSRFRSAVAAAFRESTSSAAMGKPRGVFANGVMASMATVGRQVAEEFLAVEWSRRN